MLNSNFEGVFYDDFYGAKWETSIGSVREITWSIEDTQLILPSGEYVAATASLVEYTNVFQEAFLIWDNEIDQIMFIESNDGNSADITLSATTLDEVWGYWDYDWDGNKNITKATIRFDADILDSGWLMTTAMHEIGNILGLGDIQPSNAIRSVQEDPFPEKFTESELWQDDKDLLNYIYADDVDEVSQDTNGDGFVDEVTNYQMWTASGGVDLKNRRGKTYSDDTSRKWDAVKAMEDNGGFSVLVEGHQNKDGKFKVVSASEEGVIGGATSWLNGGQITNEGYEDLFAMDFNGNNYIGY